MRVDPLFQASDPARASGGLVTFELRSHLVRARENGVTQEELVETITHLAFYAGWPSAMAAVSVAKEVFESK